MRDEIIEMFCEKGSLIQPEAADYLLAQTHPMEHARLLLGKMDDPPAILSLENIVDLESKARTTLKDYDIKDEAPAEEAGAEPAPKPGASRKKPSKVSDFEEPAIEPAPMIEKPAEPDSPAAMPPAAEAKRPARKAEVFVDDRIQVLQEITGNSTCEGKIEDFKNLFNDRFRVIKRMLRKRRELMGATTIDRLRRVSGEVRVIGMVTEARVTKNKHKMLDIEDDTGAITVLLKKDSQAEAEAVLHDEVIGLIGRMTKSNELFVAESILRPDIPVNREASPRGTDSLALFISDIHVGSKTFMADEWGNFTDWLNGGKYSPGNGKRIPADALDRIKYIVCAGDVVDGIGVYPRQEEELEIKDIYAQYEELAGLIRELPDHIKIVMIPGNHDAVRPAEPQPAFSAKIQKLFPKNIIFAGNPAQISLEGASVLAYHGKSMDDLIASMPGLSYEEPAKVMIEMLKRRHIAPIYGDKTPLAPEKRDYMVIHSVPEVFVTGHVHSTAVAQYRGIRLINASTWQSQTSYQKMRNIMPDPAKAILYSISNRAVQELSFT